MDDTDLHSDRQEARKSAGLWWSPGLLLCTRQHPPHTPPPPRSHFHPLFLCGWAQGCRLMKGVWTTKKSGSHLADTPAHLWPSESSHHDRPPHPPPQHALSPRRHAFPWVKPRRLAARSLPNAPHPRWHQRQARERRKSGGANGIRMRALVCEKISSKRHARVAVWGRVNEDYKDWLQGWWRSLFQEPVYDSLRSVLTAPPRILNSVDEFHLKSCLYILDLLGMLFLFFFFLFVLFGFLVLFFFFSL